MSDKRPNVEFVSGAYSEAENAEKFVIEQLNLELDRIGIKSFKFFSKEHRQEEDIMLKQFNNPDWETIWIIDVHECQFGPPEGGRWPWPLHLPHGVENIHNPFRYKTRFDNLKNFSMVLIDLRKHDKWTTEDIVLVTKEVISKCSSHEIKTHTKGHYRTEPMYLIPYNMLESLWGAEKCVKWFLDQKIIKK